jgi:type II secretory pathway pseudopilin PulG
MRRVAGVGARRGGAGFTMMEAMIALVLLMIGILGMGALAGASVRSNIEASDRTTATYLAERLLSQMRTEAMGWNRPQWSPALDVETPTEQMPLLSKLPAGVSTGTTGFIELTRGLTGGPIKSFDQQLRMVNPGAPGAKYCVHYRLTWLQPDESIRADVRVYWMRRGADPGPYDFYGDCGAGNVDAMATDVTKVRCVARASLLQRNVGGGV